MADSTAPIAAVNPELGRLINRAKAVLEMIGGAADGTSLRDKRKPRGFDEKKDTIMIDLTSLEAVLDLKSTGSRPRVDEIRLNQQVRRGLMDVNESIEDLMQTMRKDVQKRRSDLTAEEIEARREAIADIQSRRAEIKARLAGRSGDEEAPAAAGAVELSTLVGTGGGAAAASAGGGGGGGMGGPPEEEEEDISEQQRLRMQENKRLDKAVDAELLAMEDVLEDILQANKGLGEALAEGDARLADLSEHMSKTKDRLDKVTGNIKRVLDVSDDVSSRCCTYMICLVVLLGIATVIFNTVTGTSA